MKVLASLALAASLVGPLSRAEAQTRDWGSFCTTGLSLNFCGSAQVSAVPNSGGGTDVTFTVLNTSGGVAGGDARAVFTAIGLDNIGISGTTVVGPATVTMNGTTYSGWGVDVNKSIGGGLNVDLLTSTTNGIVNGISSACGPVAGRIADGGIGGCASGPYPVTISFHISSTLDLANANLFIKQQGVVSSECIIGTQCSVTTTTTPEPATLMLFGTGLFSLAGGMTRRRRRNLITN